MDNRICLDTDIIIEILRGNKETIDKINELEKDSILATTFINLFELYTGVFLSSKKEENFNKIKDILFKLNLLNLSHLSTSLGGQINAYLREKGKKIESRDLLIASIVMTNDFLLFTKNKKHFESISRLKLYEVI